MSTATISLTPKYEPGFFWKSPKGTRSVVSVHIDAQGAVYKAVTDGSTAIHTYTEAELERVVEYDTHPYWLAVDAIKARARVYVEALQAPETPGPWRAVCEQMGVVPVLMGIVGPYHPQLKRESDVLGPGTFYKADGKEERTVWAFPKDQPIIVAAPTSREWLLLATADEPTMEERGFVEDARLYNVIAHPPVIARHLKCSALRAEILLLWWEQEGLVKRIGYGWKYLPLTPAHLEGKAGPHTTS